MVQQPNRAALYRGTFRPASKKLMFSQNFTAPFSIFWVSLIVYGYSLLPGVGEGDVAKFQFVGYILGTPHATGYPLYIFLNYIFTHLFPFGSLAFKANLLSAVFAATALVVVYQILVILECNKVIAWSFSLIFGASPSIWSQAIVAEVYTLNLLLVVLVSKHLLLWHIQKQTLHFYLSMGIYAFSFGNHLLMITMLPALAVFIYLTDRGVFRDSKKIALVTLVICFAALQYAYPFFVYYSDRKTYIEMAVPDFKTLIWYVTGAQFKSRMFAFTLKELFLESIPRYFDFLKQDFRYLIPLVIPGIFHIRSTQVIMFLGLIYLGDLFFALNYAIGDIVAYFFPSHFIFLIFVTGGTSKIMSWLTRSIYQRLIRVSVYLVILVLPFCFLAVNYSKVTMRHHIQKKSMAESLITAVGKDSLIISPNYETSETLWYYLLGLNLQGERNLFMVHHFNPEAIKNYLLKQSPLYLPEERIFVPYGMKVYVLDKNQIKKLIKVGLRVELMKDYIYRIY